MSEPVVIELETGVISRVKYTLTKEGDQIILRGSDGSVYSVTDSDTIQDVPAAVREILIAGGYVADQGYVHTDNNYTTEEKTKLADIEAGAQVNVIQTVKRNGAALTPDADKAVDIEIPIMVIKRNNVALTPDADHAVNIQVPTDESSIDAKIDKAIIKRTSTGAVASFDDGGDDLPVKALTVNIDPVQSGSGDPSPTNVRPISGWTGAKVTRCGANLLPFDSVLSDGWTNTVDGVTATYNDGVMHISGTHNKSGWSSVVNLSPWGSNPIELPSGITIRTPLSPLSSTSIALASVVDDVSKNLVNGSVINAEEKAAVRGFYIAVREEETFDFDIPMIVTCGDERPTAYEPYQSETYSITFPSEVGTVYGGTLDVTNGVLTVDFATHEFTPEDVVSAIADLSSTTISPLTRVSYTKTDNPSFPSPAAIATEPQTRGKYSHGVYNGSNSSYDSQTYHGYAAADAYHIFIPCAAAGDTVAEYLYDQQENGTPVQLCFPLAEPLTYQLTPHEVNTLLGGNAIYADTGDTSVTYRADPSIVIQNIINALSGNA